MSRKPKKQRHKTMPSSGGSKGPKERSDYHRYVASQPSIDTAKSNTFGTIRGGTYEQVNYEDYEEYKRVPKQDFWKAIEKPVKIFGLIASIIAVIAAIITATVYIQRIIYRIDSIERQNIEIRGIIRENDLKQENINTKTNERIDRILDGKTEKKK